MISIVIPVYNEEENIQPLHKELKTVLDSFSGEYEIIFVDDGSTDKSIEILGKLGESDEHTRTIKLRRNYGQTAALLAGFNSSKGEIIVSMDADLQNDPKDIPTLLEKMEEGWDVVCGWRRKRNDPLSKKMPSKISNWLAQRMTDLKIHDIGCTLRAYKKKSIENIELYGELHRYLPILIYWKGYKITEIQVNHRQRKHGRPKYGLTRIIKGFLDLILVKFLLSFSSRPILLFGVFGLLSTFIGLILGLYLLYQRLFLGLPIGDRPLLMLTGLLIMFGIQFISTGLIADMIVRTHYTTRQVYEIEEEI